MRREGELLRGLLRDGAPELLRLRLRRLAGRQGRERAAGRAAQLEVFLRSVVPPRACEVPRRPALLIPAAQLCAAPHQQLHDGVASRHRGVHQCRPALAVPLVYQLALREVAVEQLGHRGDFAGKRSATHLDVQGLLGLLRSWA